MVYVAAKVSYPTILATADRPRIIQRWRHNFLSRKIVARDKIVATEYPVTWYGNIICRNLSESTGSVVLSVATLSTESPRFSVRNS